MQLDEDELNYIPELQVNGGIPDLQGEVKGFIDVFTEDENFNISLSSPQKMKGEAMGIGLERDYQSEGLGFLAGNPDGTSQPVGFLGCLDEGSSAVGHLHRQKSRVLRGEIGQAEAMLSSKKDVVLDTVGSPVREQAAKGFLDYCPADSTFLVPSDGGKELPKDAKEDPKDSQKKGKGSVLSKLQRKKKKDGASNSSDDPFFFSSSSLEISRNNSEATYSTIGGSAISLKTQRGLHASDSFQSSINLHESASQPASLRTSQTFSATPSPRELTPQARSPALIPSSPPQLSGEHLQGLQTPPGNRLSSPPNLHLSPSSPTPTRNAQRRKSLFSKGSHTKEKGGDLSEPLTLAPTSPEQDRTKRTKSGGSFKSPVMIFRSNEATPFLSLPKSLSSRLPASPKSQRGIVENRRLLSGHGIEDPVVFLSHLIERVHRTLPIETHDSMVTSFLDLSGQSDDIFVCCLYEELNKSTELSVVMRQASPAVLVLKTIVRPILKSITEIVSPLARFGRRLDEKGIELIGSDKRTKHSARLKEKLENNLSFLLCPKTVPLEICILSYRCVECIKQCDEGLRESVGIPLSSWAVGAMLFLRYLVPMLTTFLPGDDNKKGRILMGRFLMKMACHSEFQQNSGGLLNEILVSSYDRYDQFCLEVCRIGEENFPYDSVFGPSHSPYPVGVGSETLTRLRDFLKDVEAEPGDVSDEWKGGISFFLKRVNENLEEMPGPKIDLPEPRELSPPTTPNSSKS